MSGWMVVLFQIAAMILVISIGYIVRKKNIFDGSLTGKLALFIVDFAMPCLTFTQLISKVDQQSLHTDWVIPIIGFGIIILGEAIGLIFSPLFAHRHSIRTFIALISLANWIYLPLPIVKALFGDRGVAILLLFNVGAQVALWTITVWTLKGGKFDKDTISGLLKNPGLIAAITSIILVIFIPGIKSIDTVSQPNANLISQIIGIPFLAMTMIGALTIPLSLVVIGAQLGGIEVHNSSDNRPLIGTVICRLLLAPLLFWGCILLLPGIDNMVKAIGFIIMAMPCAVSSSIFTERYAGDTDLASRAILVTTVVSVITVPGLYYLYQHIMGV
ncbi:MAG: AEC family transporter [bacterium]